MARNSLTIAKAISDNMEHIICKDGVEFDIKVLDNDTILLHHIEKNGKSALNNRVKMKLKDAETFAAKKHGGIDEITSLIHESVKPEVTADESNIDNYAPDAGYQFEDDKMETGEYIEEEDAFEDTVKEEKPEEEINFEDDEEGDDDFGFEDQEDPEDSTDDEEGDFFSDDDNAQKKTDNTMPKEELKVGEDNFSRASYGAYAPNAGESVILHDMIMEGNIHTKGSVNIMGVVSGNILAERAVTVSGYIAGDIQAGEDIALTDASSGAEVRGNLTSTSTISIDTASVVIGDIAAGNIIVRGSIMGNIDTQEKITICGTAHIKGNIISKEIEIEPGATIDGVCVQKYAENNSENFFDNYTLKMTDQPLNAEKFGRNKNIGSKAEEVSMAELIES